MNKNSIFLIFFNFFIFFTNPICFADNLKNQEQNLHGAELCKSVDNFLNSFNLKSETQGLIFSKENNFPFNIKISIPANPILYSKNYSEENLINLTLAFKIEDVLPNKKFFENFLKSIQNLKLDYDLDLLFTYGDSEKKLITKSLTGTEYFLRNINSTSNSAILCINFSENEAEIIPGGTTDSSPLWFVKRISKAFSKNNIKFRLQGANISSLYRFNLLKTDERLSLFLKEHIPSACINIPCNSNNSTEYNKFFTEFLTDYSQKQTDTWERHYYVLNLQNNLIFFGELFIILLFIFFIILNIFLIFIYFNKNNKTFIKKFWLIIPLNIIFTLFSLILSQFFVFFISKILNFTPFLRFTLKIIFATLFFPVEILFLKKKNLIQSEEFYTFYTLICSIFNLILFSFIDIALFFLFFMQFLIIYISRHIKKIIPTTILFILLITPYIPYFIQFLRCSTPETFEKFINCSVFLNLGFSFAIQPIIFYVLRLVSKLIKILRTDDPKNKEFQKQNIIAILSSCGIFIIIFIVLLNFLPDSFNTSNQNNKKINLILSEEDFIEIELNEHNFFDETTYNLEIKLLKNAEECLISINSKNISPIIYSDDLYFSNKSTFTDSFLIPVFPPNNLNFKYISQTKADTELIIQAIFLTEEENSYIFQEKRLKIPKKQ